MGLFGYSFGITDEESATTAFLLVFLLMLVLVLTIADHAVGHLLNRRLPFNIPESAVTMALGMVLGGLITLLADSAHLSENPLLSFSPTIFFLAFLPPIIFNEGYNLRQQFFFGYIKEILIYAIIGTALSAFVMALFLYKMPGKPAGSILSFAEAASFGGLVTSTDPVAVLAILGQLRVEPALFFLVFGESVLNDAVALTIFNIAEKFIGTDHGAKEVAMGFADFVIICIGSCIVGYLVPCLSALVLKKAQLKGHVVLELSVYLIMSYVPYVLAQIVGLSGIVAILVAGVTTRSYTHRNLSSRQAQEYADFFYRLCSFLADNAVFLYLGMTVFGLNDIIEHFNFAFVGWAFFGCLVSRGVSVVVLSAIINYLVKYTNLNRVSYKNQFVLWFAGLRGAVAFAAATDFSNAGGKHDVVLTTTMGIVIVFNFVVAPLTMPVIKSLGMPMNVKYETSQPPRMPRMGRWASVWDRKHIDKVLICECAQRGNICEAYHDEVLCPLAGRSSAQGTAAAAAAAGAAGTSDASATSVNASLHRRRLSTSHHVKDGGAAAAAAAAAAAGDDYNAANSDVTIDYDGELPAILRTQQDMYNFGRPVLGSDSWGVATGSGVAPTVVTPTNSASYAVSTAGRSTSSVPPAIDKDLAAAGWVVEDSDFGASQQSRDERAASTSSN